MLELGKIIICRDGKRFMIISISNEDEGLLDLDNYRVRNVEDIKSYVNQYHFGIYTVTDSFILNK